MDSAKMFCREFIFVSLVPQYYC